MAFWRLSNFETVRASLSVIEIEKESLEIQVGQLNSEITKQDLKIEELVNEISDLRSQLGYCQNCKALLDLKK